MARRSLSGREAVFATTSAIVAPTRRPPGRLPRGQELDDVILRPRREPGRRDVRCEADAFRVQASCEARLRFDGPREIAGRMALRAMRDRLDEVASPVPGLSPARLGHDGRAIEEKELPETDPPAKAEGKRKVVLGRATGNSRQGAYIRQKVANVLERHLGVACIGQRRVVVLTRRGHAGEESICEVGDATTPDPVVRIR
jgi:hypothetical protein